MVVFVSYYNNATARNGRDYVISSVSTWYSWALGYFVKYVYVASLWFDIITRLRTLLLKFSIILILCQCCAVY